MQVLCALLGKEECRGRSPLLGCGVSPQISYIHAAAGGESINSKNKNNVTLA